MKRLVFSIFVLLFTNIAANSQLPCLPEGITFSTQSQIDNFQVNYPGCTAIEGNVTISDGFTGNITNLLGLDALTTIGGNLSLMTNNALSGLTGLNNLTSIGSDFFLGALGGGNNALTSLAGMESLIFLGGNLFIGGNNSLSSLTGLNNLTHIGLELFIAQNEKLNSLTALENLVSIGGILVISENNALTSLSGLNNIEAGSIASLSINSNQSLSTCAVESICTYLSAPGGTIEIRNNASGCNSEEEVKAACPLAIEQAGFVNDFKLFPNPAGKTLTISGNNATTIQEIVIYCQTGQKVLQSKPANNALDISKLRPGMYIVELKTNQGEIRKKLMIE